MGDCVESFVLETYIGLSIELKRSGYLIDNDDIYIPNKDKMHRISLGLFILFFFKCDSPQERIFELLPFDCDESLRRVDLYNRHILGVGLI